MPRHSILSFPQVFYWVLFVLPIGSYAAAFAKTYSLSRRGRFVPIPSSVTNLRPAALIFGSCSCGVVPVILFISWRAFRFLSGPRFSRKSLRNRILAYVLPILGVLGGVLYGAMSFWDIDDTLFGHFTCHIGAFASLTTLFAGVNIVLRGPRIRAPAWILFYDAGLVAITTAYALSVVLLAQEVVRVSFYIIGALGFSAIALTCARAVVHGWQVCEQGFVVPFINSKKR